MEDGQRIEDIALEMAEDHLDSAVARKRVADLASGKEVLVDGVELSKRLAKLARISQCAPTARITSGGRYHPERCR